MSTTKTRRFLAAGMVAATLALASIGATGVSAREENDDFVGATVTAPVAQQPFTYETVASVPSVVAPAPFANPNPLAVADNHDN